MILVFLVLFTLMLGAIVTAMIPIIWAFVKYIWWPLMIFFLFIVVIFASPVISILIVIWFVLYILSD